MNLGYLARGTPDHPSHPPLMDATIGICALAAADLGRKRPRADSRARPGTYASTSPSERSSELLGWAPTAAAAGSPPLKRIIVGIDEMP
jgi:hypothetical protein